MLAVDPAALPLDAALAEFARVGYARLGRVVSDEGLAALGARVDDLMSARVRHEGMFFQHDSATGRYEDLTFGAGWQGPSRDYRKIEKLELDPLFRAYHRQRRCTSASRARSSTGRSRSIAPSCSPRARAAAPRCRGTRTAASSGA